MKYEKGKIVTGTVSGITEYGAFVKLDEYYTGLIHISEFTEKYVRNITDYVNIGDRIRVLILDVDSKSFHLSLSIKEIKYKSEVKVKNRRIIETYHGFNTLKRKLNLWIQEYLKNKKISKYY